MVSFHSTGPVTKAIAAVRQPAEPARRGTLRALAALPLAVAALAGPAVALPYPDAELIRACDSALDAWAESDSRGVDEDWSDARIGQNVDVVFSGTERASNLKASTHAGLQAKARLLARHYAPDFEDQEPDAAERLLISLLRDLAHQGGRA